MADANATTSTARELAQFALSGLGALVLLAVVGAFVLRDRGRAEAVRDAQNVAELTGRGIVEPAPSSRASCAAIRGLSPGSTAWCAAVSSPAARCA